MNTLDAPEKKNDAQLTTKQEAFMLALLGGNSITVAAKAAGINEKTGDRWLRESSFQAAYRRAQKQLFEQALTALMNNVEEAIATLHRNMVGEEVPPSVQVRCAQILLEQSINVFRMGELEKEVAELKDMLLEQRGIRV